MVFFVLSESARGDGPPANDSFLAPADLGSASSVGAVADLTLATGEAGETVLRYGDVANARTVWWKWRAPADGALEITPWLLPMPSQERRWMWGRLYLFPEPGTPISELVAVSGFASRLRGDDAVEHVQQTCTVRGGADYLLQAGATWLPRGGSGGAGSVRLDLRFVPDADNPVPARAVSWPAALGEDHVGVLPASDDASGHSATAWYRWRATFTGLALWAADCGWVRTPLLKVQQGPPEGPLLSVRRSNQASTTGFVWGAATAFYVAEGEDYWLEAGLASYFEGLTFVNGDIRYRLSQPEIRRPPNDNFADRLPVGGEVSATPFFAARSPVTGRDEMTIATLEPGEPPWFADTVGSTWWTWTAQQDGPFVVWTSTGTAPGPIVPWRLFVGAALDALVPVPTYADPLQNGLSAAFLATAGQQYVIAVATSVEVPVYNLSIKPDPLVERRFAFDHGLPLDWMVSGLAEQVLPDGLTLLLKFILGLDPTRNSSPAGDDPARENAPALVVKDGNVYLAYRIDHVGLYGYPLGWRADAFLETSDDLIEWSDAEVAPVELEDGRAGYVLSPAAEMGEPFTSGAPRKFYRLRFSLQSTWND